MLFVRMCGVRRPKVVNAIEPERFYMNSLNEYIASKTYT